MVNMVQRFLGKHVQPAASNLPGVQRIKQGQLVSVRWYRLAADQGDAGAQNNLGWMYANGEGVPEDDAEAAGWYRLAAGQGHAGAQDILGLMYADGEGVLQDNVTAHMWFNIAGANGAEFGRDNREIIERKMTPF